MRRFKNRFIWNLVGPNKERNNSSRPLGWPILEAAMNILSSSSSSSYFFIISFFVALQLFMQNFGLLNHFLPSSSILDKGLPIWHFDFCISLNILSVVQILFFVGGGGHIGLLD